MRLITNFSSESTILLAISIILFMGFFSTRAAKLVRLPKVSGYILAGIIIGPHMLGLVPAKLVTQMSFISDIALAFIAFGVGKFFTFSVLKTTGKKVIFITLMESLLAGLLVGAAMHWGFHFSVSLSVLLGAIATATAPASTVMTIKQYHAKGAFVDMLLQIVALDDVVCLFVFTLASAFVNLQACADTSLYTVFLPLLWNALALVGGALCAVGLKFLLPRTRSDENRLILAVAVLLGLCGVLSIVSVSPLLACMVFGCVYINLTHDEKLFAQLDTFTPPVLLLFFVLSGMNLDVGVLGVFGIAGVGYFLVRMIGKYLGAYLGCVLTNCEKKISANLGTALIPQAGVAIGLAFLSARMLPADVGKIVMTIILASCVLYELVGPALAKYALICAGAIENSKVRGVLCREKDVYCEKKQQV